MSERYVKRLVEYHENILASLATEGLICQGDVHSMALQYTSPVLVLLAVCDRQSEKEEQVMAEIEAHVRQFWNCTRPRIEKKFKEIANINKRNRKG